MSVQEVELRMAMLEGAFSQLRAELAAMRQEMATIRDDIRDLRKDIRQVLWYVAGSWVTLMAAILLHH